MHFGTLNQLETEVHHDDRLVALLKDGVGAVWVPIFVNFCTVKWPRLARSFVSIQ